MDEPIETWTVAVAADTRQLQEGLAAATGHGRQFSRAMTTAFSGLALQGKSLGDVFRSLALDVSRMALQAAFKPLERSVGSIFSSLLAGGLPAATAGASGPSMPVPFAAGGVISSPIAFPLAGGTTGIAGERGAEAIMPLSRGPDGRLGVVAEASRAASVTINVTTPDAESFRRTEAQLSAMLARVVSQGQRNL